MASAFKVERNGTARRPKVIMLTLSAKNRSRKVLHRRGLLYSKTIQFGCLAEQVAWWQRGK